MKRVTHAAVVVAAALAAGCIQSSTLVKVKADGSGTIEQQMLVGSSMMSMMEGMGGENRDPGQMFDEASMREAAGKLGPGVRLVSHEPIERNGMKGARAVFEFDDVNTLKVDQSAGLMGGGGGDPAGGDTGAGGFSLTLEKRGDDRVLTISTPEPPAGEAAEPEEMPDITQTPPEVPPEALGMMKMMFQNLRITLAVEVDGKILRTNAEHRSGSRVTLLDVNFDELMKDEDSLKAMQGAMSGGGVPSDLQQELMKLKGVAVNTERVITIEWR